MGSRIIGNPNYCSALHFQFLVDGRGFESGWRGSRQLDRLSCIPAKYEERSMMGYGEMYRDENIDMIYTAILEVILGIGGLLGYFIILRH
jgi:hypothetical protein